MEEVLSDKMSILYTTFPTLKEAKYVIREIMNMRLAACANLFNGSETLYLSDNEICETNEVSAIIKTESKLVDEVMLQIKKMHSYDVPCIVEIPILKVDQSYISWVTKMLSSDYRKI